MSNNHVVWQLFLQPQYPFHPSSMCDNHSATGFGCTIVFSHLSVNCIFYYTVYTLCILCVYFVYSLCILCVYFVYTLCILCIIYFVCTLWIMCKLYCVYMRVILAAKSHSLISLSIVCWLLTAVYLHFAGIVQWMYIVQFVLYCVFFHLL